MSILTKIRDLVTPPLPTKLPWRLTEGKYTRLKILRSNEEWSDFQDLLDVVATFYVEQLLATTDSNEVHFLRGAAMATRRAGTLVDEMLQKESHSGDDAHRDRLDERAADRRRLSLYASPYWTGTDGV